MQGQSRVPKFANLSGLHSDALTERALRRDRIHCMLLKPVDIMALCWESKRGLPIGMAFALPQRVPALGGTRRFLEQTLRGEKMSKRQKGFSLIELLIVVAIILIIAAIAIPNLIRSRMAANEASAVGSVRTMNTAAIEYNSTYGNGFPGTIQEIGTTGTAAVSCNNAELIDSVLTAGTKSGYNFAVLPGSVVVTTVPTGCTNPGYTDGYGVVAWPVTTGTTGQRSFCSDASGVIRFDPTGAEAALANALCPVALSPLSN
jgi:type IV pilus assembly protein PilA